ncbi:MAG: PIN domain-containing protein [Acidimicrobiia bacterium]
MNPTVYDAGALVAADRNERTMWADHCVRLEAGIVPLVPAPVLGQVSRSSRQAQLRRFLRGCDVVAFDESDAHTAGRLLGRSQTSDIVDAAVVVLAVAHAAEIVTDDRDDIARLLVAARSSLPVVDA